LRDPAGLYLNYGIEIGIGLLFDRFFDLERKKDIADRIIL